VPRESALDYEVFVSDPIPMDLPGLLPNGQPHLFQPLSSTLVYGEHDAVLAEPPLTIEQGEAVGDWVAATGKNLTHIFASHGHGDHWFTASMLADRFDAEVVALAGTIEQMRVNLAALPVLYDKLWPGLLPEITVTAVSVPGNRFTLEGHDVVIVAVGHTDTDESAVLHLPDLGLVVAGDAVYNGVHQFLGESAAGGRDGWRGAIDTVESLGPRWVVASHKNRELDDDAGRVIAQTRQYLADADKLLKENSTALGFFNDMLTHYPERRLGAAVLWVGTKSLYANTGDPVQDALAGWVTP
jgi:glyoxylase-like metal-dependent hydrolase (beta-lactamase superfamily II)